MRFLTLLLLLPLAACYQPLYGGKAGFGGLTAAEIRLNTVEIAGIEGEQGQKLRNLLIDRFYRAGRPAAPRYKLAVTLSAGEQRLGLQKDATTARTKLVLSASYSLTPAGGKEPIFSSSSRSSASHNILNDQYATLASEEDAYRRGLKELADLITTRVLLYLGEES